MSSYTVCWVLCTPLDSWHSFFLLSRLENCPAAQSFGCCACHWRVGTILYNFLPDKETWTLSSCSVCWMLCIVHTTRQLAQFFVAFIPNQVIVQLHSLVGVVHTTRQFSQFFVAFFPFPIIVQLHSLLGVARTTRELAHFFTGSFLINLNIVQLQSVGYCAHHWRVGTVLFRLCPKADQCLAARFVGCCTHHRRVGTVPCMLFPQTWSLSSCTVCWV